MNFIPIIGGLFLLIFGGDWLLKAAVSLSLKLNVSKAVIGLTVVSFATSAPELIVSINAALHAAPDLSLGNVIGSNIANLGLVLGITTVLTRINVAKCFYKTDWPVMMVASVLLYFFLWNDAVITRIEGLLLLSLLIAFLVYLLKFQNTNNTQDVSEEKSSSGFKILLFLVSGGIGLWLGSELLVKGATNLAQQYGVTERIIGITVVSIGTSIPELAASIIAVIKKEKAISLGNLIGSNIFNILAVLGITSIITPIQLTDYGLRSNDILWMLAIAFAILPLVLIPKRSQLNWKAGTILLLAYLFFIFLIP